MISALLLTFGVAGICGNFIAGALVGNTTVTAGAVLILWGLGYGAVPVSFQTWILGGLAVEGIATTSVLWIGAALAVLTLLVVGRGEK
ncbi:putative MFS family arabinose efflux permease [Streptomyces sp. SFB5A]|jgi:hypothetical protein|uniref:Putative MFS family arabinose efflux permease n=1 Tax=Streptomyces nymphaeiformis TaxID=2663842 RepID=A0A7W7XAG5_9ACTN|nr:hypothetical protein [Streptomyces nymphaeiformis]MBB4981454.1 putative MFS family arabinose efflux permease [Streptomyces nymphaeiformis]